VSDIKVINVLHTAFTLADPKSIKKTVKLSIFFTLSGYTSVKAVCRMLMKLTPGINLFILIFYFNTYFIAIKLGHFLILYKYSILTTGGIK
jgi:hypothetical protein